MNLGQMSEAGLDRFSEYLAGARGGEPLEPPRSLLSDPESSLVFSEEIEVDPNRVFGSRFECAEYLNEALADLPPGGDRDVGMWAWLSLLYFEQLCPANGNGQRRIGETARYIPSPNAFQRFYRHLLLGPFLVYRAHRECPDVARAVLANPVNAPGDIVEQLASRQELVSNPTVMRVATKLYVNSKGSLKRGAGGKGPGSPRRLVDIVNQFDLTYDLYAMAGDDLIELLPREFDQFRDDVKRRA